ncbi:MAG: radical SAM protein [Treponema sp.]|nr:radical SAM protein [Treponema sp.]
MNVIVINSPLVQLNTPYPSGAYLSAFFKSLGHNTFWADMSIELFYSIYSKDGLKKLFEFTESKALKLAKEAEFQGDDNTAFNLRRYVSTKEQWINWIDTITAILSDGKKSFSTREKEHQLLYSPFAPRGNRMEGYLGNLSHEPTVDDVRFLCSYALADLADYITAVFDESFSLIRYAEAVCAEGFDFAEVEAKLDSPVLINYYEPVLKKLFDVYQQQIDSSIAENNQKTLVCISMPFAGTFVPALFSARYIKNRFGNKVYVCAGGGFANTDLRNFNDKACSKYFDALSYDRGYGSYIELLEKCDFINSDGDLPQLYKLRVFNSPFDLKYQPLEPLWEKAETKAQEEEITSEIVPDYSDIDFSKYLRVCDDKNPMHRLWTDGTWIKAYLAHGCYWHKCLFCDTKLDYVCGYKPVNVDKLFDGLVKTAEEKGIFGIHFVDEALPPAILKTFAIKNAQQGNPLYYWGNIRFEKPFTKDFAALLSNCGLGAVSAGLEVATGKGLANINKGTDLETIVAACAAFKEAGILVHAYMIYGFWYDTPQTIIDSMETLRQFFAAGLLDSAFWHRFVVTDNSEAYDKVDKNFNSISYKKYGHFGPVLDSALESWMHGEKLDMKVTKWFNFEVPFPTVPKNLVEQAIEKYERANEKCDVAGSVKEEFSKPEGKIKKVYWLGSKPVCCGKEIDWFYLQEENRALAKELGFGSSEELSDLLWKLRPSETKENRMVAIKKINDNITAVKKLDQLHGAGLVIA